MNIFQILGMGCHNYLRNIWNLVDIMAASFSLFYLFYVFKYYYTDQEKDQVHAILIPLSCTRCIQMVRFLRIFGVVRVSNRAYYTLQLFSRAFKITCN